MGSRVSKTLSLTLGLPLKCRVILGSLGRGSVGSRVSKTLSLTVPNDALKCRVILVGMSWNVQGFSGL